MLFVMQTVRICKVGIFTSQLLRFFVHHIHKVVPVAAAHIFGQHQRCIVAGRYHHQIEQLQNAELLPFDNAGHGTSGAGELRVDIGADGGLRVFQILHMIADHHIGHDFGNGGRFQTFIRIFFIDRSVCVQINEHNAFAFRIEINAEGCGLCHRKIEHQHTAANCETNGLSH